ncbi:hypothetical protein JTE90_005562 [Oedothorax gibbosus]|uniref:NtA domain-containing protein n=1 Tax=Oedothorax gibbosus TaxID=931172 RepID=A0AAV6V983_9ARAC|nr:hypothetical protein JTE90_005562 [Oedothorax gibbosus]
MHFTFFFLIFVSLASFILSRRCTENVPLFQRVFLSDIIFTGTVQKIYRKSPNLSTVQEYNAMVLVKRVLKGTRDLQNQNVVVGGLGNRSICESDTNERDTRIFLLVNTESGYLKLNSSLLRMNIHNLESIDATVNGKYLLQDPKFKYMQI